MEAMQALTIIRTLADGIDPQTGEVLPDENPCQHPQTTRALFFAVRALENWEKREQREKRLPANAGKSWDQDEDIQLRQSFTKGATILELARIHERTAGAIRSRLELLGMMVALGQTG